MSTVIALGYLVRTQRPDGGWVEQSLCTQFTGIYAGYELMTQIALTAMLSRVVRGEGAATAPRPWPLSPRIGPTTE